MNEIEKAQQEITEAREKLASAELRLSALSKPVEREYRAGEWVPEYDELYWLFDSFGDISSSQYTDHRIDQNRIDIGNAYPTEAIAESSKAHSDWWREFDMSNEGGNYRVIILCGKIEIVTYAGYDGGPSFRTRESSRAAIERLGGEQKVIDMLTRGRVFRFKWGGE